MSKLKQILMIGALVAAPFAMSGVAGATNSGSSTNTGPGSNNQVENVQSYTCKVDNDNKVTVTNTNTQQSTSGSATNSGNTNGGGATSGSATNSNGTTISYEVKNGGCVVTSVTPPKPRPSGQGAAGGAGSAGAQVAMPKKAAPTVLANTSGDNTTSVVAGVLAAGVAVMVAGRGAVAILGRR